LYEKVRPSGNGGVTISPAPSAGDMRDVIYTPYRSRFKECYEQLRDVLVS